MKYKIETKGNETNIEISEIKGKQKKLLEAFQECQEGRCSCPTQEYSKLNSLEIENNENSISLQPKSKPGKQLDKKKISKCLEYTKEKVKKA